MSRARDLAKVISDLPALTLKNTTAGNGVATLTLDRTNSTSFENSLTFSTAGTKNWFFGQDNDGTSDLLMYDWVSNRSVYKLASGGSRNIIGFDNFGYTVNTLNATSCTRGATWTASFNGETTGSFNVVNLGYPSGVKGIYVVGWWQIDGYSGSGGADHAVCAFGQSTPDGGLYASTGTVGDSSAPYVMTHDGDGVVGFGTYGFWHNGFIPVNSNGSIYYRLGNGYSGGTHYIRLQMYGYVI